MPPSENNSFAKAHQFKRSLWFLLTGRRHFHIFIFAHFLIFSLPAFGQKFVKGVVVDAEKRKPIPNASIFLSNTSNGTRAADDGSFQIYIPAGKYDLVVSSVGYQTASQNVSAASVADFLTITLAIKAEAMETVVIEPFEKNGWDNWGKFFLDNFIGTSANASECVIRNAETIRFRNSKKKNELTAYAAEPLRIENKALGYIIHYQLESFSYNFNTHYLIYTGYPLFEPMKGGESKQKRWKKARENAYYGSMMHFMRAVYRNKIMEEGFEVKALQKVPNREKSRVKEVYASSSGRTPGGTLVFNLNSDSSEYYDKVLRSADYWDVVGSKVLPGDSIAYAADSVTAGLDFANYLLVVYKPKLAPLEYRQQFPKNSTAMMSQITLINAQPVLVEANGSYYDPATLMSLGFWAWSEKMSLLLPYDYIPEKRER